MFKTKTIVIEEAHIYTSSELLLCLQSSDILYINDTLVTPDLFKRLLKDKLTLLYVMHICTTMSLDDTHRTIWAYTSDVVDQALWNYFE